MTSGGPLRVGVIGLGDIAQKAYLPVLAARADVTLSLLGRDNDRLTRIGRQYGASRCVTRLDDLLDSGIDVAFVHTTTGAHFGLVEQLLSACIHVLVDKPLAPSFADARHLVDLAERQERSLAVGSTAALHRHTRLWLCWTGRWSSYRRTGLVCRTSRVAWCSTTSFTSLTHCVS